MADELVPAIHHEAEYIRSVYAVASTAPQAAKNHLTAAVIVAGSNRVAAAVEIAIAAGGPQFMYQVDVRPCSLRGEVPPLVEVFFLTSGGL